MSRIWNEMLQIPAVFFSAYHEISRIFVFSFILHFPCLLNSTNIQHVNLLKYSMYLQRVTNTKSQNTFPICTQHILIDFSLPLNTNFLMSTNHFAIWISNLAIAHVSAVSYETLQNNIHHFRIGIMFKTVRIPGLILSGCC